MSPVTKTHLDIDPTLLEEARQLGGFRSKTDAATQALKEFVQRRMQLKLLEMLGTIEYEDGFEPIAQRQLKRAIQHKNTP